MNGLDHIIINTSSTIGLGSLLMEYRVIDLWHKGLAGRVVRGQAMGAADYMGLIRVAKSHVCYYLQSLVLGMMRLSLLARREASVSRMTREPSRMQIGDCKSETHSSLFGVYSRKPTATLVIARIYKCANVLLWVRVMEESL